MERGIPLWVFRIIMLLLVLVAMWFGWTVKNAASEDPEERSVAEQTALQIASYPDMAIEALKQVMQYGTGEYIDIMIRIEREPDDDYGGFSPVAADPAIALDGLLIRADAERMVPGWRLIGGAFTLDGRPVNSVLLMSPENRIMHRWLLDEIPQSIYKPKPSHRKLVHGFDVLPDGSLIFAFDGGISLQRFDKCSRRMWSRGGAFHHSVTLDDRRQTVWSFGGIDGLAQVDVETGEVLRYIPTEEIIAANPDIDILELRRNHDNDLGVNSRNTDGEWLDIAFHYNDIDPLPAAYAGRFKGFVAGDLLVSARSLNLVFVMDPDTLRFKWWRVGAAQRQHDPDWLPDGRIMIFNNRMSRDYSEIIALDPVTFAREILFDGRKNDFYTRIRGKQQMLDDGTIVLSSPQQGRAFEVDPAGEIVLELINTKPGSEDFNYTISELRWLPPDFFETEDWSCSTTN